MGKIFVNHYALKGSTDSFRRNIPSMENKNKLIERIANLKLAQDANLYTKSKKSSCIPSMNNKCCPLTLYVVCLLA